MGQIIKADIDGVEQKFEVLGSRHRSQAIAPTHFLSYHGELKDYTTGGVSSDTLCLRLLRKRHTASGAVFEETGAIRHPVDGECCLFRGTPYFIDGGNYLVGDEYPILKPIGTISEDGKTLYRNDGTNEAVE